MERGDGATQGATVVSFTVSGALRGRPVSVEWLDPSGDPPGIRLRGDGELRVEVDLLVYGGADVAPTPTGPVFRAAIDPAHVGLVTICSALDDDVEIFVDGDVPEIPGLAVPPGAVS
jgi:hypothetical protein